MTAVLNENYVSLPPDSTGKKARTFEVTVLVAGVPTVVQIPAQALTDSDGNPIAFGNVAGMIEELQTEGRIQTEILLRIMRATDSRETATRDEIAAFVADNQE